MIHNKGYIKMAKRKTEENDVTEDMPEELAEKPEEKPKKSVEKIMFLAEFISLNSGKMRKHSVYFEIGFRTWCKRNINPGEQKTEQAWWGVVAQYKEQKM